MSSGHDDLVRASAAACTRLAVGALVAFIVACGHERDDGTGPTDDGDDGGGGISIGLPNGARADTLAVGEHMQLSLTRGKNEPAAVVTWSSNSVGVASISSAGRVTALARGSATVTATSGSSADSVSIVVVSLPPAGPLPVFAGAVGFGVATPAGRRGAVIQVTNLNDAGPGSLRAALRASGARTIVFDVSGTITLSSRLTVSNPFVTVAGQTAPAPGVTLRGAGMSIRTHDVLVQHIRFRPGDMLNAGNVDAVQILGPDGYNIVIDHVSMSFATDENFSTWYSGARDITVSNSIVSDGLNTFNHSKGALVGDSTVRFSMIGSLFANNQDRHPYLKGATRSVFANNVVYNWGGNQASYLSDPDDTGPSQAAIVGNVYIRGPETDGGRPIQVMRAVKDGTRLFVADNSESAVNGGAPPADPWALVRNDEGASVVASAAPLWPDGFTAMPNGQVFASVLARAGAWPASRDAVDQRVVADVRNRTGRIPDNMGDAGGYPATPTAARALVLPANPSADDDGDGYTNLEEWLHQLARAAEGR